MFHSILPGGILLGGILLGGILLGGILLVAPGCSHSAYRGLMVLERRELRSEEVAQLTPQPVPLATFTASVDAFGYHLTGILLMKRMDSSSYRIGFVNQLGISMFVFDLGKERYHLISCMEQLANSRMIERVRDDVRLLLFRSDTAGPVDICRDAERPDRIYAFGTDEARTYCFVDTTRQRLTGLETASRGERLVRIDYVDVQEHGPAGIVITHDDVPVVIHLTRLDGER